MERLDVDGLFWLVDKPDDKVAGRLRFDPAEGVRLSLIGTFKDFVPSGHNPPVHMNAIAGGRFLTLEGCHFDQLTVEYAGGGQSGLTRHEYRSDLLFAGLHRDDSEPLQFRNVLLHLRYLEQWVNELSTIPVGYEDKPKNVPRIVATFDVLERKAVIPAVFGEGGIHLTLLTTTGWGCRPGSDRRERRPCRRPVGRGDRKVGRELEMFAG